MTNGNSTSNNSLIAFFWFSLLLYCFYLNLIVFTWFCLISNKKTVLRKPASVLPNCWGVRVCKVYRQRYPGYVSATSATSATSSDPAMPSQQSAMASFRRPSQASKLRFQRSRKTQWDLGQAIITASLNAWSLRHLDVSAVFKFLPFE